MGVVTVSRLYGAGGRRVAELLASALGYRLADRELVEEAARRAGVDPGVARRLDERTLSRLEEAGLALAASSPETAWVPLPLHDRLLAEGVAEVIRRLADEGGVVILGRGGQAVLRGRADAVHLQLVGELEDRARRVAASQGIAVEQARERCRRMDAERAAYVRRFYGIDIRDPLLYHAVLNTTRLGVEGAARVALAVVRAVLGA